MTTYTGTNGADSLIGSTGDVHSEASLRRCGGGKAVAGSAI